MPFFITVLNSCIILLMYIFFHVAVEVGPQPNRKTQNLTIKKREEFFDPEK
jgi:hypothetical protein